MITIKARKGEPAPYLAYKRIKQLGEMDWRLEWRDRTGTIRTRTFENVSLQYVLACAKAEAKKYKNPEYKPIKIHYNRFKQWLGHLVQR